MNKDFLKLLRCPYTNEKLSLFDAVYYENGRIKSAILKNESQSKVYQVNNGVPRFVIDHIDYIQSFSLQWGLYKKLQLDSFSGVSISNDRFFNTTGWTPEELSGKLVLDVGCGSGRFAEIAVRCGANVVCVDLSYSIDACFENLSSNSNINFVQADLYNLPFDVCSFDYVYSLGVLQHLPNVELGLISISKFLKKQGGKIAVDFYYARFLSLMHPRFLIRLISLRIPKELLFKIIKKSVRFFFPVMILINKVPLIGKFIIRLIPISFYVDILPLTKKQSIEWSILDTFDMLATTYDKPQTIASVRKLMSLCNFSNIIIAHRNHLAATGEYKVSNF